MNRDLILKTAVCYWSNDDECYVAESPLCEAVIGDGDSEEEAMNSFTDHLNEQYIAHLEKKLDRRGRPAKNRVTLHVQVLPKTKAQVDKLSKLMEASQGEIIDWAMFNAGIQNTRSSYQKEKAHDLLVAEKSPKFKKKNP